MKKKLILIPIVIVFILVLSLSLVACNSAQTQGLLANPLSDHSKEVFTYSVFNTETSANIGTYTVTLQLFNTGATVAGFGNKDLTNVNKGILVSGNLSLLDGTDYKTGCYFDLISGSSYMIPAYTYRIQKANDVETFVLDGIYDGATLNYTRKINGETSTGSIKVEGTYYDNNEFHQSLRTITTFSTSLSFGFAVPLVTENEASSVSLTATCNKQENITVPYYADGINTYSVNVSRSTVVDGVDQTLYYAVDTVKVNGWNVKNALIKIVEPFKHNNTQYNIEYSLTGIQIF